MKPQQRDRYLWSKLLLVLSISILGYQALARDSAALEEAEPLENTLRGIEIPPSGHKLQTPAPLSIARKKDELCSRDFDEYNRVLRLVKVSPQPPAQRSKSATHPRVICYVITVSTLHSSRARFAAETWGQRCDKLLFFSNDTGTIIVNKGTQFEASFPIINLRAPPDYDHLWLKHKEAIKYLYDHYRHDYDWFYKADDDSYVVVDNLRAYLMRPEIMMNYKRQPIQLGTRFSLPDYDIHQFVHAKDKVLGERWAKKNDRWLYNSGGPGFAMNRIFLDKFARSMDDRECLSAPWASTLAEDAAVGFCMSWYDAAVWDTRDRKGRERWLAVGFRKAYETTPEKAQQWWINYHEGVGGIKWGDDACAPDAIGFHYVKGNAMHHVERQLYFCREGDDVADIDAFNNKYGLSISTDVLKTPW